jgi:hypothetical protein
MPRPPTTADPRPTLLRRALFSLVPVTVLLVAAEGAARLLAPTPAAAPDTQGLIRELDVTGGPPTESP